MLYVWYLVFAEVSLYVALLRCCLVFSLQSPSQHYLDHRTPQDFLVMNGMVKQSSTPAGPHQDPKMTQASRAEWLPRSATRFANAASAGTRSLPAQAAGPAIGLCAAGRPRRAERARYAGSARCQRCACAARFVGVEVY